MNSIIRLKEWGFQDIGIVIPNICWIGDVFITIQERSYERGFSLEDWLHQPEEFKLRHQAPEIGFIVQMTWETQIALINPRKVIGTPLLQMTKAKEYGWQDLLNQNADTRYAIFLTVIIEKIYSIIDSYYHGKGWNYNLLTIFDKIKKENLWK